MKFYMARSVTRNEGMFVGYTSGAAMQATIQLLNEDYLIEIIKSL